jgi:hypothetical protein
MKFKNKRFHSAIAFCVLLISNSSYADGSCKSNFNNLLEENLLSEISKVDASHQASATLRSFFKEVMMEVTTDHVNGDQTFTPSNIIKNVRLQAVTNSPATGIYQFDVYTKQGNIQYFIQMNADGSIYRLETNAIGLENEKSIFEAHDGKTTFSLLEIQTRVADVFKRRKNAKDAATSIIARFLPDSEYARRDLFYGFLKKLVDSKKPIQEIPGVNVKSLSFENIFNQFLAEVSLNGNTVPVSEAFLKFITRTLSIKIDSSHFAKCLSSTVEESLTPSIADSDKIAIFRHFQSLSLYAMESLRVYKGPTDEQVDSLTLLLNVPRAQLHEVLEKHFSIPVAKKIMKMTSTKKMARFILDSPVFIDSWFLESQVARSIRLLDDISQLNIEMPGHEKPEILQNYLSNLKFIRLAFDYPNFRKKQMLLGPLKSKLMKIIPTNWEGQLSLVADLYGQQKDEYYDGKFPLGDSYELDEVLSRAGIRNIDEPGLKPRDAYNQIFREAIYYATGESDIGEDYRTLYVRQALNIYQLAKVLTEYQDRPALKSFSQVYLDYLQEQFRLLKSSKVFEQERWQERNHALSQVTKLPASINRKIFEKSGIQWIDSIVNPVPRSGVIDFGAPPLPTGRLSVKEVPKEDLLYTSSTFSSNIDAQFFYDDDVNDSKREEYFRLIAELERFYIDHR